MEMGLLAALGVVAALLCTLLAVLVSGRRRTRQDLVASRADVEALRARLEQLEASRVAAAATPVVPPTEYLITTAGSTAAHGRADDAPQVPNRAVLSVTFGEPLVKVVALAFGLRQAFSAESRNRIGFEMRREVKRARKERRRKTKQAARKPAAHDDHGQKVAA